jgi:hypothetical protein
MLTDNRALQRYYQHQCRTATAPTAYSQHALTTLAWLSSAAQASVFWNAALDGVMHSQLLNLSPTSTNLGLAYFSAFNSTGSNLLIGVACTESFLQRVIEDGNALLNHTNDQLDFENALRRQPTRLKKHLNCFVELSFFTLATAASLPFLCLPVFRDQLPTHSQQPILAQLSTAFSQVPQNVLALGILQFITTIPVIATGLFALKDSFAELIKHATLTAEETQVEKVRDKLITVLEDLQQPQFVDTTAIQILLRQDDPSILLRDLFHHHQPNTTLTLHEEADNHQAALLAWLTDYSAYGRRLWHTLMYTITLSSLLGYAHYAAITLAFGSTAIYTAMFALVFIPLAALSIQSTGVVATELLNAISSAQSSLVNRFQTLCNAGFSAAFSGLGWRVCRDTLLQHKAMLLTVLIVSASGFPTLHVTELFMNPTQYTGIKQVCGWFLAVAAMVSSPIVNGFYSHQVIQQLLDSRSTKKTVTAARTARCQQRLTILTNMVKTMETPRLASLINEINAADEQETHLTIRVYEATKPST